VPSKEAEMDEQTLLYCEKRWFSVSAIGCNQNACKEHAWRRDLVIWQCASSWSYVEVFTFWSSFFILAWVTVCLQENACKKLTVRVKMTQENACKKHTHDIQRTETVHATVPKRSVDPKCIPKPFIPGLLVTSGRLPDLRNIKLIRQVLKRLPRNQPPWVAKIKWNTHLHANIRMYWSIWLDLHVTENDQ
jgi:hypothetical protein